MTEDDADDANDNNRNRNVGNWSVKKTIISFGPYFIYELKKFLYYYLLEKSESKHPYHRTIVEIGERLI